MLYRRTCFLSFALFLLPVVSRADAPRPTLQDPQPPALLTVAVADFPGPDREMGRFLAETLLTDLTRSERLQMLERIALQEALADLQLPSDSPLVPAQTRKLGSQIHADRLIVGSYLVREDQVILNARLLDTRSGLTVPGGAMNVTGNRKGLLEITHKLARLLHRRVTGSELLLEEAPERAIQAEREPARAILPPPEAESDPLESSKRCGLIPTSAKSGGIVAERDLAGLVGRVAKFVTPQSGNTLTIAQTAAPVSRLRALVTLVKILVSPDDMAAYRSSPSADDLSDAAQIPAWGQPYVAAALDQGWLPSRQPLHARDNATWAFIQILLVKMPITPESPLPSPTERPGPSYRSTEPPPAPRVNERYTGLIVDVGDLELNRTLDLRILDEDNREVYPDPKHIPDLDWMQENGMAAYIKDPADAKRSGSNPLIVQAICITGPGNDTIVVSNEDAQRIREANKRGRFLAKWAVSILTVSH